MKAAPPDVPIDNRLFVIDELSLVERIQDRLMGQAMLIVTAQGGVEKVEQGALVAHGGKQRLKDAIHHGFHVHNHEGRHPHQGAYLPFGAHQYPNVLHRELGGNCLRKMLYSISLTRVQSSQ